MPYPLTIEIETETLLEVKTNLEHQADIIMFNNISVEVMEQAVKMIRKNNSQIKIEASGNITL